MAVDRFFMRKKPFDMLIKLFAAINYNVSTSSSLGGSRVLGTLTTDNIQCAESDVGEDVEGGLPGFLL